MPSFEAPPPTEAEESGGFRAWPGALARWLFGRRSDRLEPPTGSAPVARYRNVCISREAGAGAGLDGC